MSDYERILKALCSQKATLIAQGLANILLCDRPDRINAQDYKNTQKNVGSVKVRAAFRELEELGLLERVIKRDRGKILESYWILNTEWGEGDK